MVRSLKLPKWAQDPVASVIRNARMHKGQTPEQRAADLVAVCAAGAALLRAQDPQTRQKVLALRDPLPASSRQALKRLREQARNGRRS